MSDCLVVIPILDRVRDVDRVADSATVTGVDVLFVVSPGSRFARVRDAVAATGCPHLVGPELRPGDYARKVNLAVRESTHPLIFTGAGDLHFHPGWLAAARSRLAPGIGVVGTNDLGNPRVKRGEHATHSLVTREYASLGLIDGKPGVLCEEYPHEWCDDELVATAKHRNAWAFAPDSKVEHLHPLWGKAESDASYRRSPARTRAGGRIFRQRRRMWT